MLFSIQTRLQGAGVVTVCGDDFFFKDIDPLISSGGMLNAKQYIKTISVVQDKHFDENFSYNDDNWYFHEENASYHKVKYQLIGFKAMEFLSQLDRQLAQTTIVLRTLEVY